VGALIRIDAMSRLIGVAWVSLCMMAACGDDETTSAPPDTREPRQICLDTAPEDDTAGLQQTWGAACTEDQQCKDITGDDAATCLKEAVIFELPDGYCSKPCDVAGSTAVLDAPECGDEGLACVGVDDYIEACALPCTSDDDCTRAGYICRTFPVIGMPGDPKFCLMVDCCNDKDCECADANNCHALEGG
jgi:hypothetical protein